MRDLDLAYLPFVRGLGMAQYASDPAFQALLDDAEPPQRPPGRPTVEGIRTLVSTARAYPGSLLGNLRSTRPRTAVRMFVDTFPRPSLNWDDLPFLRERTRLPILLKGILHPDDARRALDYGMDGIVVSTHGGRQACGTAPTSSKRSPSAPLQFFSGGPTCTGSGSPANEAFARYSRTRWRTST